MYTTIHTSRCSYGNVWVCLFICLHLHVYLVVCICVDLCICMNISFHVCPYTHAHNAVVYYLYDYVEYCENTFGVKMLYIR